MRAIHQQNKKFKSKTEKNKIKNKFKKIKIKKQDRDHKTEPNRNSKRIQ